jgi:hypothetical protein
MQPLMSGSITTQTAVAVVCWRGMGRPDCPQSSCSTTLNMLQFSHKIDSFERTRSPFSQTNKPPVDKRGDEEGTGGYSNSTVTSVNLYGIRWTEEGLKALIYGIFCRWCSSANVWLRTSNPQVVGSNPTGRAADLPGTSVSCFVSSRPRSAFYHVFTIPRPDLGAHT